MKLAVVVLISLIVGGEASAHSEEKTFRTVSFVCADNPDSTAFIEKENVLGQRIAFKVTFISGVATLFIISKAERGNSYSKVQSIDLRSEQNKSKIRAAKGLAEKISAEGLRYCWTKGAELRAARQELLANHEFNRSHSRYRGK